jgi:NADH-quinone oxidoreductase subunit J
MEALFFWVFAVGMLLSGLSVVINRNPVASALSLVVSMCFLAALFVTLGAFFLATVQVLVYAGAVMVLFLFIIMLLDVKSEEHVRLRWMSFLLGLALAVFFSYELSLVLRGVPQGGATLSSIPQAGGGLLDDTRELGRLLFTKYLLPFQVVGVLLLVATVGVVLLSRKDEGKPGVK